MENSALEDDDYTNVGPQWSSAKLNMLITCYSRESVLWDTTSSDYRDRRERNCANVRIATTLSCNVHDAVQKLRHLRTYYARELTKIQTSFSDPSKKPYKSRWIWFKKMDEFLHCHMSKLPQTLPVHHDSNSSSEHCVKVENTTPPPASPPESCDSFLDASPTGLKRSSPGVTYSAKKSRKFTEVVAADDIDDPDLLFGRHVAHELKLITDMKSKQFAKLQIHSILFNAQYGVTTIPNNVLNCLTVSTTKL